MSEPNDKDREIAATMSTSLLGDIRILAAYREEIESRVRVEEQERLRRCEAAGANLPDKYHVEHARAEQAEVKLVEAQAEAAETNRLLRETSAQADRIQGRRIELEKDLAEARAEIEELKAAILGEGGWDQRCKNAEAEIVKLRSACAEMSHQISDDLERLKAGRLTFNDQRNQASALDLAIRRADQAEAKLAQAKREALEAACAAVHEACPWKTIPAATCSLCAAQLAAIRALMEPTK